MPPTAKRLDLRFGSFACSVQGFDDPVMPVQQVLRAIQHLLEETPELSDAGISFDAEAIESLIEEIARRAELAAEEIEITPGLVIVHRGENDVSARMAREADAGAGADPGETRGEAWARPFSAGGEPVAGEAASGEAKPAYVNIFAARGAGAARKAARNVEAAPEDIHDTAGDDEGGDGSAIAEARDGDAPDPVAQDRLRDIFAEAIGDPEGSLFSERLSGDEDDGEPLNLFARSRVRAGEETRDEVDEPIFGAFELRGDPEPGIGRASEGWTDRDDPAGDSAEPLPAGIDAGYTVAGLVQAAGATTVPDMMICAAAWMVLLQGKVSFTRREVLEVFDQIPGDHEKTLEARIKGFGRATRNGQLVAIEDGTFGLSQEELDRFERLL